jgi:cytochrome c1
MERRRRRGLTQASDRFRLAVTVAVTVALLISSSGQQGHSQPQNIQAPFTIPYAGQAAQTVARRANVDGVLGNSPENIIRRVQNPQAIDRKTAMPNMGVNDTDARDIAAYLYTLR